MDIKYVEWLENKIDQCLEDKDLKREHWALCQALKKYRELSSNPLPVTNTLCGSCGHQLDDEDIKSGVCFVCHGYLPNVDLPSQSPSDDRDYCVDKHVVVNKVAVQKKIEELEKKRKFYLAQKGDYGFHNLNSITAQLALLNEILGVPLADNPWKRLLSLHNPK